MSIEESPKRSSSILYALGHLAAETAQLRQEQYEQRQVQEELPQRVVALLTPQLTTINATLTSHGARLTSLERRQWLWMGGGTVVITLVGWASKEVLPLIIPHILK